MFVCLINLSNSSFVLILHVPSLSFVRPKIFLNTFLSNAISLFFTVSLKTHLTIKFLISWRPIIVLYILIFKFFDSLIVTLLIFYQQLIFRYVSFYVVFLVNLPISQVFVNSLELFFWDITFCQWVFIASGRAQYLTRVGFPFSER